MTTSRDIVKSVFERYFPGWTCTFVDSESGIPCIRMANSQWVIYEDEQFVQECGLFWTLVDIAFSMVQVYWKQGKRDFNVLYNKRQRELKRIKSLWSMEPV